MSSESSGKEFGAPAGFYIPVYEQLVEDFGYTGALVYGKVRRYCESRDQETGDVRNQCFRSQSGLASDLGMDRKTIIRALAILCEAGWLDYSKRPGKANLYCLPAVIPIPTYAKNGTQTR